MKAAHEFPSGLLTRHSPLIDPSNKAVAVYNAPVLNSQRVHERNTPYTFLGLQRIVSLPLYHKYRERHANTPTDSFLIMPRLNASQAINGEVDITAGWGIFGTNAEGNMVSHIQTLSPAEILGEENACSFNPEDARVLTRGNGIVEVAYTAAHTQSKKPYPAFLRLQIKQNGHAHVVGGSRELAGYLPAGKNVAPLTDISQTGAVAIYRKETEDHRFTFIKRNSQGQWEEYRTIDLTPHGQEISWVGEDGRFGLTGIEPIPKLDRFGKPKTVKPGDEFLMVIHGFKYIQDGTGKRIPEYALGVMKCRQRADNTFDVLKVSNTPIFEYKEAQEIDEYNPNKRVVYCTGYTVYEGKIYLPITIGDKRVDWYSGNIKDLWDLFPQGPDASQRRVLRFRPLRQAENNVAVAA